MAKAYKLTDDCTVRFSKGILILDYTETWQVVHTDPFRNSIDVFKATYGLPAIGYLYLVGGFRCICIDAKPSKVSDDHKSLWNFQMRFTNDPSAFEGQDAQGEPSPFDPTKWAKEVNISFNKEYVPVTNAEFSHVEDKDGLRAIGWGDWLDGHIGPVIDSATTAKLVEKPMSVKTIQVSRWVATWNDYWNFHDTINRRPVRISDGFGISERYPARTLRFDSVSKSEMWTGNGSGGFKKVYRQTVELSFNPDEWLHKEVDAGTEQLARVDKTYNPATNKLYKQDEVNELAGVKKVKGVWEANPSQAIVGITSDQGDGVKVAVGSPVPLNAFGTVAEGTGKVLKMQPLKLVFELYPQQDFGPLNL